METSPTTTGTTTTEQAAQPPLTSEQEIAGLRAVHQFLSSFDRVPGALANQWAQALDTVAVIANSLIAKAAPADTTDVASTEEATQTN